MNIMFFTDCMSIGPEHYSETEKYPGMVEQYLEKRYGIPVEIDLVSGSGETTYDAVKKLKDMEGKGVKYDYAVFGYGINDALPRGLNRDTRGRIIRFMYSIGLNKEQRLFVRSHFLNPLEFVMQHIRGSRHYDSTENYVKNVIYVIKRLKKFADVIIFISINPVLNYRFVKGNYYINKYNSEMADSLKNEDVHYIDVFKLFSRGIEDFLAEDKFHYGEEGHKAVAEAIIEIINKGGNYLE